MASRSDELLSDLGFVSYNAMALALAPATIAQLALRHWRGEETLASTWQRLGGCRVRRPKGPLIWFHALTVGECAVALPVVFRCLLEYNENVRVLLTTGTPEAHALLAGSLPRRVVLQCAPFENAASVTLFLRSWRPQVAVFVESPSWPMLVELAGRAGLRLALLNARMGSR
ncbi:3-deoxy-D-manno-octulosonic-acidtransferase [Monoraphidium neglectum]|uniref:3-deoxy-D-manno-octulosonic-acidtransferase n=1 Tax=Monoraphidium neglectum TaxID=145388 RepID=A0A0D2KB57_9CHLO|nr:3-deoxy-D-manno-octulosonic-acidtransferase [Monoraphidium neglectum]KIY93183.1 3-deoxy-D-manno-octulosonic-acidtransferase [Monoraphidium neglectum]|eukprot:XP_013892203.1 3-deoxy-D-manno-octulosonic-acidtransferase [Monoraphidium neglectum]